MKGRITRGGQVNGRESERGERKEKGEGEVAVRMTVRGGREKRGGEEEIEVAKRREAMERGKGEERRQEGKR